MKNIAMKKLIALVVLGVLAFPVFASEKADVPKDLAAAYKAWDEALVKADGPALEKLYAEDATFIEPDGKKNSKKDAIKVVASGEVKIANPTTEHWGATINGDTAIFTGEWKARETMKGETKDVRYAYTDVWVKRQGKWLVLVSQLTPILAEKK
jgi:ketosteroid isomerase-like protein